MIKAAIIGFAHMHVNEVALYISEQPDTELIAIADAPTGVEQIAPLRYTPAWNKQNVCENYCSNYYDSYTEMLDKEKPEMVYILTENCHKTFKPFCSLFYCYTCQFIAINNLKSKIKGYR